MYSLDNWLLDKVFERFAHWFQKLTGRDNFFLAHACNFFSFLLMMASQWLKKGTDLSMLFIIFTLSLGLSVWVWIAQRQYEIVDKPQKCRNQDRADPFMTSMRICLNCIMIVFILAITCQAFQKRECPNIPLLFALAFVYCCFYFSSCTPLPPQEGKMKSWISRIRSWRVAEPSPA